MKKKICNVFLKLHIFFFFRQEIDKRIQEKCDEFMVMKKNQQRLIESLQASLEAEARSKAEVMRTKKKLETDIQELENALDHASRVNIHLYYSFETLCFIYAITVYLLRRFSPNFNVQISNIDNYCSNFIVRHDSVQKISYI